MTFMQKTDLKDFFNHHPPKNSDIQIKHALIRKTCLEAAENIFDLVPGCPERTMAINKLREAMMWANAAIAIRAIPKDKDPEQMVHPSKLEPGRVVMCPIENCDKEH